MSSTDKVAVMQQFSQGVKSSTASVVQTGLLNVSASSGGVADGITENTNRSAQVRLLEKPVAGMLLLRASSGGQISELGQALQASCDIPLATRLSSHTSGHYCVRWMGPDTWLLSCPLEEAFSIEQSVRSKVAESIAIVQVAGGYTVFELAGSKALEVLKKSSGYDTHPDNFPAGKVVNTTFAKAQITMRAITTGDEAVYELIVRRSFSDYLWLWLQRASFEYGLEAVAG